MSVRSSRLADRVTSHPTVQHAATWLRYLVGAVLGLIISGTLFFLLADAAGLTDTHSFGWLFGGWLVLWGLGCRAYGRRLDLI